MKHLAFLSFALSVIAVPAFAQSSFFSHWEDRVRKTSARQPEFPIPVIAPSSQLVQLARFDVTRQFTSTHFTTVTIDNGKGVNLIPLANTEVDLNFPALIEHNNAKVVDGAGDFSAILKYRPFASPTEAHNYSFGGQAIFTVPTGSYKNGTAVSTIQPYLLGGKGFGRFAIQSSLGAVLPNSSVHTLGRTVLWNTTAQMKVGKIFWPEIESNATYFVGGANDGKSTNFISPGLMISRIKLRQDPRNRLALIFGGDMQIATSGYHVYNHNLVFTSRFSF